MSMLAITMASCSQVAVTITDDNPVKVKMINATPEPQKVEIEDYKILCGTEPSLNLVIKEYSQKSYVLYGDLKITGSSFCQAMVKYK